jgi:DNA-binding MarR family transcriptional regulator
MAISDTPETGALDLLLTEVTSLANQLRRTVVVSGQSLGPGEAAVVELLEKSGPMSVPNIARQRHTSRQNIQVVVNRLEKEGLVAFSENPAHQRSPLVQLCAAAITVSGESRTRRSEVQKNLVQGYSEEELRAACVLLERIRVSLRQQQAASGKSAQPRTLVRQWQDSVRERVRQKDERDISDPAEEEMPISLL